MAAAVPQMSTVNASCMSHIGGSLHAAKSYSRIFQSLLVAHLSVTVAALPDFMHGT
jgi:hypothetical protein